MFIFRVLKLYFLQRYKIVIQYDGSFFKGWQLQNEKTVQGDIENSLKV